VRAVDTSVVARYVVQDDPEQARIATEILKEPCFIADTVLLETAWLLSSRYGMARADLAATLADIVRLPKIAVSDPALVGWAVDRFARGADFADMIHLLSAGGCDSFASFERHLPTKAGADAPIPIETLG
jgi:predicted nucleic-acid-binding protein